MPTIFKKEGFRFFFFSDEHTPKHIHIEKAEMYVRIEIESIKVTDSYNITLKDIKKLQKIVEENKEILIGAWDEYFG